LKKIPAKMTKMFSKNALFVNIFLQSFFVLLKNIIIQNIKIFFVAELFVPK